MKNRTHLRTVLIAAVMLTVVLGARAQTLVFSQVLLVGNIAQTVPAGKVWKIETYLLNNSNQMVNGASTNCGTGGSTAGAAFIMTPPGGSATSFYLKPVQAAINATSQAGYGTDFPVWIPAGTALASNCASWYLSVIEFTIVP